MDTFYYRPPFFLRFQNKEREYAQSLPCRILEFEAEAQKRWPARPWLPTGNTVPRRFVSSGVGGGGNRRRRTLEKPLTLRHYPPLQLTMRRTHSTH